MGGAADGHPFGEGNSLPNLAVLTPALTPEQNFRCQEVGGNGVISYVERDRTEWARQDSNLRPGDYESLALTN